MSDLPADVRAMLVCPRCGGELRDVVETGRAEGMSLAGLACDACARLFPVEEGVPYLVDECSRPLEPAPR